MGQKSRKHKFTIYHAVPYLSKKTGNIIGGEEFAIWVSYLVRSTPEIVHSVLTDFQMVCGDDSGDISRDGVSIITFETRD